MSLEQFDFDYLKTEYNSNDSVMIYDYKNWYLTTYKVSGKTVNSIDYEITVEGIKGYATVAQTKYYDGSERPTLPINLGNYALYFVSND